MIIVLSTLFFYFLSSLLSSIGLFFVERFNNETWIKKNNYLKNSSSFFIGTSFFVTFIILLNILLSLSFSIAISLLIGFGLFVKTKSYKTFFKNLNFVYLLFIVLLQIILALIPIPEYFISFPEIVSPFDGFGSITHSFRAANISQYFYENNYIPIFNQNIGQSLFATLPYYFKLPYPQVNLIVWKSLILFHALLFNIGFLSSIVNKLNLRVFFSATLLFFTQTAIAFNYVQTTDAGSTLIFSGSADALFSIFSFIIFILILYDIGKEWRKYIVLIVIVFSWNYFGAQNIILAIILSSYLVIYYFQQGKRQVIILFVILTAGILGSFGGGLLSFNQSALSEKIPGLMNVSGGNTNIISLRYPNISNHEYIINTTKNNSVIEKSSNSSEIKHILSKNFMIKSLNVIYRSFKSIFIGLICAFLYYYYFSKYWKEEGRLRYLFHTSVILIVAGLFFTSSLVVYDKIWELSRFYYLGNYMFMMFLAIIYLKSENKNKGKRYLSYLLIIISCYGPVKTLFNNIHTNYTAEYDFTRDRNNIKTGKTVDLSQRFLFLIQPSKTVGEKHKTVE